MELEIKKIVRRLETLQATLDLVYHDREILEDIQASIKSLQEKIDYSREHQEKANLLVRAEVHDVKGTVEDKVDEVGKAVTDSLVKEVAKKKVVMVTSSFFGKFKHLFNRRR